MLWLTLARVLQNFIFFSNERIGLSMDSMFAFRQCVQAAQQNRKHGNVIARGRTAKVMVETCACGRQPKRNNTTPDHNLFSCASLPPGHFTIYNGEKYSEISFAV